MDDKNDGSQISALETLQTLADEIRRLVDKYPNAANELSNLGDAIEELDVDEPDEPKDKDQ